VQASCPHCAQRIVIDDAKVPDRPFNVKCPKCQNVVRLQGKGAASADAPAPEAAPPSFPEVPAPASASGPPAEEAARREVPPIATPGERALVSLLDRNVVSAVSGTLTRLGYAVDTNIDGDEAARSLDQGVYSVVATARVGAAPGKGETLYQRITRMNPEGRRRIFVVLVGDEFKSADGNQAFTVLADIVLHTRDAGTAEYAVRTTYNDRRRLYQAFMDSRHRFEASAG
jgi:predicted Zn finger-like uncharacterized protein